MAGHSQFKNIMHRKGRQDAAKSKLFGKLAREITVSAKLGVPDPTMNARLRAALVAARAENMPKDNIDRAIKKASGGEGENYEEIRYEGYGLAGAAIIVDCMTDNRTRTVADVRHAFAKNGGNMGQEGSVAFMFQHCGQFIFAPGTSEDQVMEVALDAGAEDVVTDEEGVIEVICPIPVFSKVRAAFQASGLLPEMADIVMKPTNDVELTGDDAIKMQKLLDALEALDDVQEVYTNASMDEQG